MSKGKKITTIFIVTLVILGVAGGGFYFLLKTGLNFGSNYESRQVYKNLSKEERAKSDAAKKKVENFIDTDKDPASIIINASDSEEVASAKTDEKNYWNVVKTLKTLFRRKYYSIIDDGKITKQFNARTALSVGNIYLNKKSALVEFEVIEKAGYIYSNYISFISIPLKQGIEFENVSIQDFTECIDGAEFDEIAHFSLSKEDYIDRIYNMVVAQDYNALCVYAKRNDMAISLEKSGYNAVSENGVPTSAYILFRLENEMKTEFQLYNVLLRRLGSIATVEEFNENERLFFSDDMDVLNPETICDVKCRLASWNEAMEKYKLN